MARTTLLVLCSSSCFGAVVASTAEPVGGNIRYVEAYAQSSPLVRTRISPLRECKQ